MLFFFFNDPETTEIYTLSLHDALPIWLLKSWATPPARRPTASIFCDWRSCSSRRLRSVTSRVTESAPMISPSAPWSRSEEHTSELQSQSNLVCRLLLEKKKKSFK